MKRLIFLTVLTAAMMALLSWVNCSNPLEADEGPNPTPPRVDTIFEYVYDTTIDTVEGETLLVIDTVIDTIMDTITDTISDTIIDTLIDTITVVDTLYDTVYIPDGEFFTICTIIQYNLNEVVWTFVNTAGNYSMTFEATADRDFTFRDLIINIDGTEYKWNPSSSPDYHVEQYLSEGATIRVKPDQPLLLGHKVNLCLTIGEL